jgi:hypothetical protein
MERGKIPLVNPKPVPSESVLDYQRRYHSAARDFSWQYKTNTRHVQVICFLMLLSVRIVTSVNIAISKIYIYHNLVNLRDLLLSLYESPFNYMKLLTAKTLCDI